MTLICQYKFRILFLACFFAGCASFTPSMHYTDLLRPRQPTASTVQEGLTVSVEEFASTSKSRQAFDADLAANGILPLLVRVENNSTMNYRVREIDINAALNGKSLSTLYGDQAADQSGTSEYAGKAAGWTLITGPFAILLWPVTIAGSAAHTAGVNRKIEQHFASMEFTDKVLKPQQSAAGFVYFKLADKMKKLENLTVSVEPSEEQSGNRLSIKFSLPPLDLTAN
jgi:hypothetical protein